MHVIRTVSGMRRTAERLRRRGTLGLVPTMGALHEGHRALIRESVERCRRTVVSIFINPMQFGSGEDFRIYPRGLSRDIRTARDCGADIVFTPDVDQMYPSGHCTRVVVAVLALRWEGASRPGHFEGVSTVVAKLLMIVNPTLAVFGQKDFQQWRIIQQLVSDLQLPVNLRMVPTIREQDGLAMSSRNTSLSKAQRAHAVVLYRTLNNARLMIGSGERRATPLITSMRRSIMAEPGVQLDYVGIADTKTLAPLRRLRGRVVLLGAVRVGRTRLIDNLLVEVA